MRRLTEHQINTIYELLKEGKPLPEEYRWLLFEGKQETELIYAGKTREVDVLAETMAVPLQKVKVFGEVSNNEWHNMLIFGDNLQILKTLLKWKEQGKLKNPDGTRGVKLIYIDPPFGTKEEFRGSKGEKAYQDKIVGARFLEWLRQRLILLKELLSNDGSIFVHLDYRNGHYIKILMDEIFYENNFRNELIVKRGTKSVQEQFKQVDSFASGHDIILFYTKRPDTRFRKLVSKLEEMKKGTWNNHWRGTDRPTMRYELFGITPTSGQWRWSKERTYQAVKNYEKYIKEYSQIMTIDEYYLHVLSTTGKKLDFVRLSSTGKPEHYVPPKDYQILNDVWLDIPAYEGKKEIKTFPTQKSEYLLERIITNFTHEGDIVLDAFAGSGTTGAVAEKLNRKWIMIDSSKFAIYTMIKRMLNLKEKIGNKGRSLKPKPFVVYNAGLYDMKILKELPFKEYRKFALELFQCKDEPHTLAGIDLDGYFGQDHVLVFKWKKNAKGDKEYVMDRGFIDNLHSILGERIGKRFFIIAPAASVLFLEDYIEQEGIKYYVLRIPYSIIDELHKRNFKLLEQPLSADISEVNKVMEQIGFDFIYPPDVECEYYLEKPQDKLIEEAVIKIKKFRSNIISKRPIPEEELGFKALSMVMIDYDFNGEYFIMDDKWFASDLEKTDYELRIDPEKIGERMMIIYMDVYGNEKREVKTLEDFKRGDKNA